MYKELLLSVDLGDESSWTAALPTAIEMCRAFDARLHVVSVVPDFGASSVSQFFPEDYEERMIAEIRSQLDRLLAQEVPRDVSVQPIVAHGTVYHEIIAAAERVGADLIIIASHRPALQDYLIGPNATRVVRHFNGSVLVVRN